MATLPNGATIIAHAEPIAIVLADQGPGHACRYVTWAYNPQQGFQNTYSGRYFHTLAEATEDYETLMRRASVNRIRSRREA